MVVVYGEPQEIWKDVNFNNNYQVSNLGRVKSKDFVYMAFNGKNICKFKHKGKILKPTFIGKKRNYATVSINKKDYKVHRLVAEAFIKNTKNLPMINHIDGNTKNNCVNNLEWCNNKHNVQEAYRIGLMDNFIGENNKNHKLKKQQVLDIRKNYIFGNKEFGCKPLARKYNVSPTTIRNIINGRKWRSV